MLLPIQVNQVKQDFEPLLGRGIGLGVAIEPAEDTLHGAVVSLAGYALITTPWRSILDTPYGKAYV